MRKLCLLASISLTALVDKVWHLEPTTQDAIRRCLWTESDTLQTFAAVAGPHRVIQGQC